MPISVFVFTDIEGSTRRWAERPEAMEVALAQHDLIVESALVDAGGKVFKHTGDGMCAFFDSGRDAIVGAATAQRELNAAVWSGMDPLRVRMAIHAGEATQRAGDWFGPALNRTARLMAVAHGGQVVVSSAVVALAVDAMPRQIALRDLGEHRLRDLAQPEHVWQLTGDGLDEDFPALRSVDRYRGNLPTLLTSFLGRDAEVDALAGELSRQRLITLVGPGGVGKTRLALQTAGRVIATYGDGAWFIDLARLSDAAALDHAVITTLRLTPRRGLTEREIILDAVREWQALVIVDNCEHMVAEAVDLVAHLLAAAPPVVVLATSRQALHLAGEKVHTVEPLAVDGGAAELFIERAASVNRDFAAEADDEAVTAICRRLDGIPLALELAAARMRSMTATELLAHLDQRFRLLEAPSTAAIVAGRHRSLQATMHWSFELLSPPAREFFARLSVFPGSFDREAAHAVCGPAATDELATLDLLDTLVDQSLLVVAQRSRQTRYSLLETMRQYGREQLTAAELDEVHGRHARHFASFAERAREGVRGADDVAWIMRVDAELDSIRAAVEYALGAQDVDLALRLVAGLEPYNQSRRNSEIWAWAEAAIGLPGAERHPLVVAGCVLRAFGGHARDNPPDTTRWARRARELHTSLNLPPDARPSIMLVYGLSYEGRLDEGLDALADALDAAVAIGPGADIDRGEALFQSVFGSMARGAPDVQLAEQMLALARRLGNVYLLTRAHTALGLAVAASDPARGVSLLEDAMTLARTADPPLWTGSTEVLAAAVRPDPREALRYLSASLDEYRASGTQQWIRRSLRDFLGVFGSLDRHEAVALLDGCASPYSTRPQQGEAAVLGARESLGAERYDELRKRGAQVSDSELPELIRHEIAAALDEAATTGAAE